MVLRLAARFARDRGERDCRERDREQAEHAASLWCRHADAEWIVSAQAYTAAEAAFPAEYLEALRGAIRKCRHFTVNNLNRDFVATRGFSVVFRREQVERVGREFPFFGKYLERALRPDCNAFYLNPLELAAGSRVDPHIDRSLRAYCKDVEMPVHVSVLYVEVPAGMQGGALVLARGKRVLARVTPKAGLLLGFDGDLTHSVERVESAGLRLSLVCEQYALEPDALDMVPAFAIETRARRY